MYENVVIIASLIGLLGTYLLFRKKVLNQIILALLVSAVWVLISGLYNYKDSNLFIAGLNMFSFSAWTLGLVIFKEIYDYFENKKNQWKLLGIMTMCWIFGMMLVEYIGYNILKIQLSSNYSGFLGLPIMHMPWWGILYYFSAGALFILLCKQLKIE